MRAGFSVSIGIQAAPERAFAFLADPANAHVIDPAVISYEPDSLPLRKGTLNTIRVRMYGLPLTMMSRTIEWDEGRRMVMRSVNPARPVVGTATHLFEPDGDGTRYTWSMEIVSNTPGGGVIAWIMAWAMKRNARHQQQRFKRALEGGS